MKILHVIPSLAFGGAERLLSDLLPLLQNECDVSLLIFKKVDSPFHEKLERLHIPIINLNVNNYYNPLNCIKLIRHLKKYDIVHAHLFPTLYWVGFASVFSSAKLVYTEHSTHNKRRNRRWLKPVEKIVYHFYKRIISISAKAQKNLCAWLGSTDARFIVIENGIDIDSFRENENAPKIYLDFLPIGAKKLIMISRFSAAKDHQTLIRAMKLIKDSTVHLLLAGEGEEKKQCQDLVDKLNLLNKVHFLGNRRDIPQLISIADIGIQSSHWEGLNMTVLEMMAGGLPVIASNVDGLKEIVEGAGLLYKPKDEVDLADKITTLLSDKKMYVNVSESCQQRAAAYDIKKTALHYMEVYKEIYEGK